MHHYAIILALLGTLAMSTSAVAAPFEGMRLGGGVSSHSLDVEETFTGSPSFAEGSDSQAGLLLDLSYTGATSEDWRVTGGVRFYPIELETHVFADDQVTIENIMVMYGRIGHVFDSINML